jgi:hypothetical protein
VEEGGRDGWGNSCVGSEGQQQAGAKLLLMHMLHDLALPAVVASLPLFLVILIPQYIHTAPASCGHVHICCLGAPSSMLTLHPPNLHPSLTPSPRILSPCLPAPPGVWQREVCAPL